MKQAYAHITVILDRSGSMESIRDNTIDGFNGFLKDQAALAGTATLTLVQFDSQDAYEIIHDFRPLAEVPALYAQRYAHAAVPRCSMRSAVASMICRHG
jgi:hypothetical protein